MLLFSSTFQENHKANYNYDLGAFIGAVHRTAACLDGEIELVCGAFSSDAEKSRETGKQLGLPTDRVYGSYKEMIEQEQKIGGNSF